MPFSRLATAAIARPLSQIAEQPDDVVDAFFERREEVELAPEGEPGGLRVWREEGFAVRLAREGRTWLSSRDAVESRSFAEALRQVARAFSAASYPEPSLEMEPFEPISTTRMAPPELADFPGAFSRAVRAHHVGFPLRLALYRHRRWVQVVGPRLVAGAESEVFYSCTVESSWGRYGVLLPRLDAGAVEETAAAAVALFRARQAPPPAPFNGPAVLGPAAVAVLLHEAVAHALEADTLAQGGNPEAAVGVAMAADCLDVLDDPGAAPEGVRRSTDDEGAPVVMEELRALARGRARGRGGAHRVPGRLRRRAPAISKSSPGKRPRPICSPAPKRGCSCPRPAAAPLTRSRASSPFICPTPGDSGAARWPKPWVPACCGAGWPTC